MSFLFADDSTTRGDWRLRAHCADTKTSVFFPTETRMQRRNESTVDPWRHARAICNECEVRVPCLEEELRAAPLGCWGMRGGLSPRERKALVRKRRREAA